MTNFNTIADGEIFGAAYEVNKSKFLAHVMHVETEEAARDFVLMIRKKYFDATHNCSAWVLGERGDKQKSNDDGEPGGTAGNPILETIKKRGLTNCAAVVTRYFGGIKLGAGGLIRAYGHTTALGLEASRVVRMTTFTRLALTIEYNFLATVENYLRQKKNQRGRHGLCRRCHAGTVNLARTDGKIFGGAQRPHGRKFFNRGARRLFDTR